MLMGYARVSTSDRQDTAIQVDALREAGVQRIFEEHASGGRWDRPELHRMIDFLRPNDVVVVWKLDRLSRSLKDLLTIMDLIHQRNAGFRSLTEAIDTSAPAGRMLMQMLGSVAEFEREMVRERTKAGMDAARARGRRIGRPPKLNKEQRQEIVEMISSGRRINAEAARLFRVSGTTVTRTLAMARYTSVSDENRLAQAVSSPAAHER
jgi:DNA invertase Pin-like site-specific DNA recombinase